MHACGYSYSYISRLYDTYVYAAMHVPLSIYGIWIWGISVTIAIAMHYIPVAIVIDIYITICEIQH